jgi:hypothetical protein
MGNSSSQQKINKRLSTFKVEIEKSFFDALYELSFCVGGNSEMSNKIDAFSFKLVYLYTMKYHQTIEFEIAFKPEVSVSESTERVTKVLHLLQALSIQLNMWELEVAFDKEKLFAHIIKDMEEFIVDTTPQVETTMSQTGIDTTETTVAQTGIDTTETTVVQTGIDTTETTVAQTEIDATEATAAQTGIDAINADAIKALNADYNDKLFRLRLAEMMLTAEYIKYKVYHDGKKEVFFC